jgi:hypothetical protein
LSEAWWAWARGEVPLRAKRGDAVWLERVEKHSVQNTPSSPSANDEVIKQSMLEEFGPPPYSIPKHPK